MIKTSIIITAYKEPKTIGRAIEAFLNQKPKNYELIVTAPDKETLDVVKRYSRKSKDIRIVKDKGEGKPSALNLVVSKAKGEVLILTDGDVFVGKESFKSLVGRFEDGKVGAVSGHPVSISSRTTMLGYWGYVLSEIANLRRIRAVRNRKRFFCSGYLFAIRKKLFPKLPVNLLSEDGFISHCVYSKGYKIGYAERALVFVSYPSNFKDWIIQKKRSAGGYSQINKMIEVNIRSFSKESSGVFDLFRFASSLRELYWLFVLFLARIYLWIVIYRDVVVKKKSHKEIWKRVESTK